MFVRNCFVCFVYEWFSFGREANGLSALGATHPKAKKTDGVDTKRGRGKSGHIERGTRKASLETTVDIANALGVSTDMLLQDSLDVMTKPLASDACLSEHSRALLTDIVGVLREHDVSRA